MKVKIERKALIVSKFVWGLITGVLLAIPIWAGLYTYAEAQKKTTYYWYRFTKLENNPYTGQSVILSDYVLGTDIRGDGECISVIDENGVGVGQACPNVRVIRTGKPYATYDPLNTPQYNKNRPESKGYIEVDNAIELVRTASEANAGS